MNKNKRIFRIFISALILGSGLAGAYLFYEKRLEKEASYLPPPSKNAGVSLEKAALERKGEKARLESTLRAMEETRKLNERAGIDPKSLTPPQNPTAEVQKTLKTIEEINQIGRAACRE